MVLWQESFPQTLHIEGTKTNKIWIIFPYFNRILLLNVFIHLIISIGRVPWGAPMSKIQFPIGQSLTKIKKTAEGCVQYGKVGSAYQDILACLKPKKLFQSTTDLNV